MKQYVIDELRPGDYEKIKTYFDKNIGRSTMDGIYWVQIEYNLLNDVQTAHTQCQPFFFAASLENDSVAFELLVRTKNRVRCDCISYATEKQLQWLIRYVNSIFEQLEIII